VAEINKFYNHYLDSLDNDNGCSQLSDVTAGDVCIFGSIIQDEQDTLKDYWSTLEQLYVPFYSNMMKLDLFFLYIEICTFL
jgi:hypothetical protein